MKVYWCNNCKVPVLVDNTLKNNKSEDNNYLDIDDEVLEWINTNSFGESKYNYFLNLKEKINKSIKNKNEKDMYIELNKLITKSIKKYIKELNEFALKYLYKKLVNLDINRLKKIDQNIYEKYSTEKKNEDYFCPNCNSKIKYMSSDIRPVFIEERILLSVLLDRDLTEENIWNGSGNRYIIDGQSTNISISKLLDIDNLETKIKQIKKKIQNNNKKINFKKFIKVNKEHFHKLDKEAIENIENTRSIFTKRKKIISFSGGKDSTVVSDLVTRAYGTKNIIHVFGDTTMEFPFTYEYVERIKSSANHPPFFDVDTVDETAKVLDDFDNEESQFFQLSKKFGPPSRVMSWCCSIFKTGPIGNLFRQIADDKKILTYYGIRRPESSSRSKYDKISRSPKISKQLVVSPIIDWYDADIWLYLLTRKIDFNEAYRYGFRRVGCLYCPNNSSWSEFLFKIFMSEKSEKWRNFLVDFADNILEKPDPEVYIDDGKWKARQGGRGLDNKETNSANLNFITSDDECGLEESKRIYTLDKEISEELYELFIPFGILRKRNDILNTVDVFDYKYKDDALPNENEALFSLQGRKGSKKLTVILKNTSNHLLTFQRIDCQLRKYQMCIGCSACSNICPYDAIDVTNGYNIDEKKCKRCKKCIAYYHKGCLLAKSTIDY